MLKVIYTCFPEGKYKALTMSYDDGREEDRRLAALLNRYRIKGTFHLNSGLKDGPAGVKRIPPEDWKQVYQNHEISCHTVLHPTIARSPIEQVALQVLEDRRRLEQAAGYPVRGMSYPNGSYSREIMGVLPAIGIEYSRVVGNSDNFNMPENFLAWKATCHHNHNLLEHGKHFLELNKPQYLHLMYVWGHSYEFTNENNWELIEEFCRNVSFKNDIWYATNIQIVDYMKAAKRLQFTVDADKVYNPSACSVWIQVDGKVNEVHGGEMLQLQ